LALYYFETSALVKLYIREAGTDRVLDLAVAGSGNHIAILALTPVEFRSAVRRRERLGDLERPVANRLIARFERHLSTEYKTRSVDGTVLRSAAAVIDRYPLRAYDALQLAGFLTLKAASPEAEPIFVCADRALLDVANAEGARTVDPTS
jgi:uncharacterized protein